MPKPQAATSVRKTPNFDFIFGRYSYSKRVIPYFQISMSFNDASSYLKLVNEMPGAAAMNWKVEELFQRDIDWARVERKIIPYLKQQEEPQFFNSLTIALLPMRNEGVDTFVSEGWNPPRLENEEQFAPDNVRNFGPITCGYWAPWTDLNDDNARLGQLSWNTDEVCGIAIDGQHRLASIKQLVGSGGESFRRTNVPVILVVLDPLLGFPAPADRDALVNALRRLFIDLNKHAQKVNRARQILLDDRDPSSMCVRALVGNQLTDGAQELHQSQPVLPLSLVDWHSEQARFDDGPYLTTILGTDWAVAKVLGVTPFEDPMAFDQTEKLLSRLESKLNVDLNTARQRLEECRKYERPFAFIEEDGVDELETVTEGFRRKWLRPLVHLLSKLEPYQALISLRKSHGTLSPEFANWYALKTSADDARAAKRASDLLQDYEKDLSNRSEDPIAIQDFRDAISTIEELKRTYLLSFAVVFQRALILAYLNLNKITNAMIQSLEDVSEIDLDEVIESSSSQDKTSDIPEVRRAESLVNALNRVVQKEPGFMKIGFEYPRDHEKQTFDRFWLCSLAQPDGPIDFTQGASTRAAELLQLIGLFGLYQQLDGSVDFAHLVDRIQNATSGVDLRAQQCLSRMYASDQSIAARILRSRDQNEFDEELKKEEVLTRASWLWNILAD